MSIMNSFQKLKATKKTKSMPLATWVLVLSCFLCHSAVQARNPSVPAKEFFGRTSGPAAMAPESIGFYSRGCLAGAQTLASDGPNWQTMRPSRNRSWSHPSMLAFIERFSQSVSNASSWPGILVGDISQPRGGPMLTGHASHQLGLDADIWLRPMPNHRMSRNEREELSALNMVRPDKLDIDPATWTTEHLTVLRTAAQDPAVQRIFVNPAIKRALCRSSKGETWLQKIRPERGHDHHFHVRLQCPEGVRQCSPQDPPPGGDGCDAALEWWFTDEALNPKPKPQTQPPVTLDKLPPDCRRVLDANTTQVPHN